ncbi:zinc ribbon domain-containing protein [Sphingomonas adhaesiva]|uniref:zinc ribbon domain-containing protein n=2 Tax=Sphingomonas adhaesiva TaxID=28212 RepID=UPI0014754410|nr:zinc ribbon domain-containing protein [Sphingomonas adhaesiva]
MAVPDLRIVSDGVWDVVHAQIEQRKNPNLGGSPVGQKRKKHLLSGLIRCSVCGSNFTISGKDYYRCAGQKERGTCSNTVSVRKAPVEHGTLAVFQHHLFTPDHARIFAEEFAQEIDRLTRQAERRDETLSDRLAVVKAEIANLGANMLAGVISETLTKLLVEREAEKQRLEAQVQLEPKIETITLPMPAELTHLFERKARNLTETLNEEKVRGEAADILSRLIESVTIYPAGNGSAEAEVVAKIADLVAFATNDDAAREGGVSSSTKVVAGTLFDRRRTPSSAAVVAGVVFDRDRTPGSAAVVAGAGFGRCKTRMPLPVNWRVARR